MKRCVIIGGADITTHDRSNGITIENAKYPLSDAEITCGYQYGVSNEVISGQVAKVSVKEGNLLLIKDNK